MALGFGTTNTTRSLTIPNSPDFNYPNSDCGWIFNIKVDDASGSSTGLFQQGSPGSENGIRSFVNTSLQIILQVETLSLITNTTPIPDNEWIIISIRRVSGNWFATWVDRGSQTVNDSPGVSATSGAISPSTDLQFLGTGSTNRLRGEFGYCAYIIDTISNDRLIQIANGVPLLSIFLPVDIIFPTDHALSSFATQIKKHTVTMLGSGYVASEDVYVPMTGQIQAIYEYTIGGQTIVNVWPVDVGNEVHDMDGDTFKFALLDDSFTPAPSDLAPHFGGTGTTDYSASEVAAGGNYTSGGATLASLDYSNSAGVTTWSANKVLISQDVGNPTNARWGVIYNDTDVNKRVVAFTDLVENRDLTSGDLEIRFNGVDGVGAIFTQTVNP